VKKKNKKEKCGMGLSNTFIATISPLRITSVSFCEGCFCNSATWRAGGDHYVGLDSK
jgi:hypothetical protein